MAPTTTAAILDPELDRHARRVAARASGLRSQARADSVVDAVLAPTYRRRAAELELASWALAARAGVRAEPGADRRAPLQAAA